MPSSVTESVIKMSLVIQSMSFLSYDQLTILAVITTVIAAYYLYEKFYHNTFCRCCRAHETYHSDGIPLSPVMDPLHNCREIVKQCILLEDHLNQDGKRCKDCINKHFLTIEALGEEAVSIDTDRQYLHLTQDIPRRTRLLHKRTLQNADKRQIAQELREIRKELVPHSVNVFRDV